VECAEGVTLKGRYHLIRKLGSGGMGAVWLAHDTALDSTCAVKIIDEQKSKNPEVRVRFAREAKAAAQLRGPHVVDVFDRGESDGLLYLAMEYLDGEDLCSRLEREQILEPRVAYRIIAHVARALSSAHSLGIVHRDLKPENIFLVPGYDEEIAKVVDFGIAQHEEYHLTDRATRTGSFLGTPYYVSPEQARGRPTDHRADLWSLGVITFQCLTGKLPFDADSLADLMCLIISEPIIPITALAPDLPPPMQAWWEKAVNRDRELRFQSAKEFSDSLGEALGLETRLMVPTLYPRRPVAYSESNEFLTPVPMLPSVAIDADALPVTQVGDPFDSTIAKAPRLPSLLPPPSQPFAQAMHVLGRRLELARTFAQKHVFGLAVGLAVLVGALAMTLYAATESRARSASVEITSVVDRGPGEPKRAMHSRPTAATVESDEPEVVPVEALPRERSTEPSARPAPAIHDQPRRGGATSAGAKPKGAAASPAQVPDYGI